MLILERFEGNIAIIEDDDIHFEVEKEKLSDDVKEGDVLILCDDIYCTDIIETQKRRNKIKNLQKSLWE